MTDYDDGLGAVCRQLRRALATPRHRFEPPGCRYCGGATTGDHQLCAECHVRHQRLESTHGSVPAPNPTVADPKFVSVGEVAAREWVPYADGDE